MKERLLKLKKDLNSLQIQKELLGAEAEEIRSYYKHQNSDTDSDSESFIISFVSGDLNGSIDALESLIDYEEEIECDCCCCQGTCSNEEDC